MIPRLSTLLATIAAPIRAIDRLAAPVRALPRPALPRVPKLRLGPPIGMSARMLKEPAQRAAGREVAGEVADGPLSPS